MYIYIVIILRPTQFYHYYFIEVKKIIFFYLAILNESCIDTKNCMCSETCQFEVVTSEK